MSQKDKKEHTKKPTDTFSKKPSIIQKGKKPIGYAERPKKE